VVGDQLKWSKKVPGLDRISEPFNIQRAAATSGMASAQASIPASLQAFNFHTETSIVLTGARLRNVIALGGQPPE
jgi:hypothetical protein